MHLIYTHIYFINVKYLDGFMHITFPGEWATYPGYEKQSDTRHADTSTEAYSEGKRAMSMHNFE